MSRRSKAYWEDIDPNIQREMVSQAFKTDLENQEYFNGLKRTALHPSTRKFAVGRSTGTNGMYTSNAKQSKHMRYQPQQDNVWTVRDVTRMGGVKERSIYNPKTKKSIVISRTDPKRTWTIFDGMNDPADIAGVFGIKFESAFGKLPPRRPKDGQPTQPAQPAQPVQPSSAQAQQIPKVTPVNPDGPTQEEKSNPEQPVKSLGISPEFRQAMDRTPRMFEGTRIDSKDLANRRAVLDQYSVPDGVSGSDFSEIRSRVLSHGSYKGYDAQSEVDARVLAKQLGVSYTGGDVNDVRKAAEERRRRGLA